MSEPPGMVIVALPAASVAGGEVYPPPLSATVPVGVGLEAPQLTEIETGNENVFMKLERDGITVTVGVATPVIVTVEDCDVEASVEEHSASGVYVTVSVSVPIGNTPGGTTNVAWASTSVIAGER